MTKTRTRAEVEALVVKGGWMLAGAAASLAAQLLATMDERDKGLAALATINEIRNSIVGCQSISWSEHIYPLVAALDTAGMQADEYEDARENVGTLIDQRDAATARAEQAEAERAELRNRIDRALGLLAMRGTARLDSIVAAVASVLGGAP